MTLSYEETTAAEALKHEAKSAFAFVMEAVSKKYTEDEFYEIDVPKLGHRIVTVMRYLDQDIPNRDEMNHAYYLIDAWLETAESWDDATHSIEVDEFSGSFHNLLNIMMDCNGIIDTDALHNPLVSGFQASFYFPENNFSAVLDISLSKEHVVKCSIGSDNSHNVGLVDVSTDLLFTMNRRLDELKS